MCVEQLDSCCVDTGLHKDQCGVIMARCMARQQKGIFLNVGI